MQVPPTRLCRRQPYRSALVSGRKALRFTFAPDEAARRQIAACA